MTFACFLNRLLQRDIFASRPLLLLSLILQPQMLVDIYKQMTTHYLLGQIPTVKAYQQPSFNRMMA